MSGHCQGLGTAAVPAPRVAPPGARPAIVAAALPVRHKTKQHQQGANRRVFQKAMSGWRLQQHPTCAPAARLTRCVCTRRHHHHPTTACVTTACQSSRAAAAAVARFGWLAGLHVAQEAVCSCCRPTHQLSGPLLPPLASISAPGCCSLTLIDKPGRSTDTKPV